MHRVVVALLVLLFAHSAWAEWVKYAEIPVASSYYDPATVKKRGNMVRVWMFTNLWTRVDGQWSRRALVEFDCKEKPESYPAGNLVLRTDDERGDR